MTSAASTRTESNGEHRRMDIAHLRSILIRAAGDRSLCRVAAERGIFCRGFRRWTLAEFDRRWRKAIGRSTHLTQVQMEQLADLWQLMEQLRQGVALACDARPSAQSPCRGWDELSNEELARFCRELARDTVSISVRVEKGSERPKDDEGSDRNHANPTRRNHE